MLPFLNVKPFVSIYSIAIKKKQEKKHPLKKGDMETRKWKVEDQVFARCFVFVCVWRAPSLIFIFSQLRFHGSRRDWANGMWAEIMFQMLGLIEDSL